MGKRKKCRFCLKFFTFSSLNRHIETACKRVKNKKRATSKKEEKNDVDDPKSMQVNAGPIESCSESTIPCELNFNIAETPNDEIIKNDPFMGACPDESKSKDTEFDILEFLCFN